MCILYYVCWKKNKKLREYSNNGRKLDGGKSDGCARCQFSHAWTLRKIQHVRSSSSSYSVSSFLLPFQPAVNSCLSLLCLRCVCTIIQMYGARPPTPVDAAVRDPASSAHTHCCAESTQQRNGRKYESVQTIDSLVTHTPTRIITLQQRPEVENIFSTVYSYFHDDDAITLTGNYEFECSFFFQNFKNIRVICIRPINLIVKNEWVSFYSDDIFPILADVNVVCLASHISPIVNNTNKSAV